MFSIARRRPKGSSGRILPALHASTSTSSTPSRAPAQTQQIGIVHVGRHLKQAHTRCLGGTLQELPRLILVTAQVDLFVPCRVGSYLLANGLYNCVSEPRSNDRESEVHRPLVLVVMVDNVLSAAMQRELTGGAQSQLPYFPVLVVENPAPGTLAVDDDHIMSVTMVGQSLGPPAGEATRLFGSNSRSCASGSPSRHRCSAFGPTATTGTRRLPLPRSRRRCRRAAPLYREFWTRFLERVSAEHPAWANASKPQAANGFPMACPFKGGPYYAFSFAAGGKLRSELYIDFGDAEANSELLASLEERREAIERVYGGSLSWEELKGKRACRIADYGDGDVADVAQHDAYIDWFFDRGARLRRAVETVAAELRTD